MTSQKLRTLVVEDTPQTLEYLTAQLLKLDNIEIIAAVATFGEAMQYIKKDIDLLVTDLGLPDGNGIDLIRDIKSNVASKAIVVTVFGDEKNVVEAIEAGADGYLLKDADGSEIAASLVDALNGIAPISPAIAGHLLQKIRQASQTDLQQGGLNHLKITLTMRESLILETLAKGFSYKEIARIHSMSFHTVNDHLKAVYKKLAVNSRGEAVYEAVRAGLINP